MKKMGKKLLALVLGLTLTVGALAGCGNNSGSSSSEKPETTAGSQTAGDTASDSASTDWPTSSVSIVVPASAGGGTDLLARVMAEKLTSKLGQSFVVVNVTGAGGSNGVSQVHDSKADGNTILFYHNSMVVNKVTGISTYAQDELEVGTHVVSDSATGFYVRSDAPYSTYQELIDYCKEHPGEVSIGVETGSFLYFEVKSFEKATGVQFNLVDAGTNSEKCTALLGGHIDVMPNQYSTAKGYIESGDFVALGFPAEERNTLYPDVPTAKEQGIDWVFSAYEFGFFFPQGTDAAIVNKLDATVKEMFDNNEIQADIENIGNEAVYKSPSEYKTVLDNMEAEFTEIWSEMN